MSELIFSWLHLSDLHAGAERAPIAKHLVQAIQQDLASGAALGLPPLDAIFVAGDIAATGDSGGACPEYEEARALLVDLAGAAGLGPDRVFVVPGNHDVQRTADTDRATFRLVQSLRAGSERLDQALENPQDRALLARRLENYLRFAKGFAPARLQTNGGAEDGLFWVRQFEAREAVPVRIVGFNTALIAFGGDDMGKLQGGLSPLKRALSEPVPIPGEIVLVLSHHPLQGGWLLDEDDLRPWLDGFAALLLSGQAHGEPTNPRHAGGPVLLSSGRDASGAPGYSIGAIVREGQRTGVRVWHRSWSQEGGRFTASETAPGAASRFGEQRIDLDRQGRGEREGPGGVPARTHADFLDRPGEIAALHRALDAATVQGGAVFVNGPAGSGKTTLVEHFLATEAGTSFPDGAAWIDAVDLSGDLFRVARRFGWQASGAQMMDDARSWLEEHLHDKRVLLVVDNAHLADAEDLPQPRGSYRTLLIRDEPSPAGGEQVLVPIGPWDRSTSIAYLRTLTGESKDLSTELLDHLAEAGADLPLALRLLAGAVLSNPNVDVESWLRAIEAASRSDRLEAIVLWVVRELPPAARDLLCAVSAGGPRSRSLIGAKPGSTVRLGELRARYITDDWQNEPHRPVLHPALRRIVRTMEESSRALEAHDQWIDWITPESPAVLSEILFAVDRRLDFGRGADAVSLAIRVHGHAINAGRVGELAYRYARAVRQLGSTGPAAAAAAQLGVLERDFGQLDRAIARLEHAIRIDEKIEWKDGQVVARMDLGTCFQVRGDHASALLHYERALVLARSEQLREREISLLGNLGVLHRELGHVKQGIEHLGHALSLMKDLGQEDQLPTALVSLAMCYRDLGEVDAAREALEQALEIERSRGNKQGMAQALETLGTCERPRDVARAIELHQEALTIYEEIGRLRAQALQLANLGLLHKLLGRHPEALSLLNEARKRFVRAGLPETHEALTRLDTDMAQVVEASIRERSSFHIVRAAVSHIRSLDRVVWEIPVEKAAGWHVIVGDNGSGKSTLLRSIALALIGTKNAAALRQDWSRWLRDGEANGEIELSVARTARLFAQADASGSENGKADTGLLKLALRIEGKPGGASLQEETETARSLWESSQDAFSAGYGPFRRFVDVDLEYERALAADPTAGRHVSLFDTRVTLAEALVWLREVRASRKGGHLLEPFLRLLGDPAGPALLPHNAHMAEAANETGEMIDGNDFIVMFEDLSDGYRSVLSLYFDLVRHFAKVHGEEGLFSVEARPVVVAGGIVLIDEIDVHLHPTWQQRIGGWLKQHFPNVQFIVTTHSPLVCQSADSVFVLPTPGTDEEGRMLQGPLLDRLRYGNILDAVGTGVFGRGIARSKESRDKLQRLVQLNRKEVDEGLTDEEREEQQHLRSILGTEAPLTAIRADVSR